VYFRGWIGFFWIVTILHDPLQLGHAFLRQNRHALSQQEDGHFVRDTHADSVPLDLELEPDLEVEPETL
jgi:hypothetical protein